MRVSVMIRLGPGADPADRPVRCVSDYARRIEAGGLPGIWVGDSLGGGRATLDPLIALATLCAATERVELRVAVLQAPATEMCGNEARLCRAKPLLWSSGDN